MRLPAALAAVVLLTASALAQTPSAPPPVPVARHPEAGSLLVRKNGDVVSLTSTGAPLGLLPPGMPYETIAITIEPGDCLVLCSDGVPDAQNEGDEEFGESRLTAIVQDARTLPSAEIVSRVFDAIDQFAGAAPQFDDITLMVLRRFHD